MPSKIKNADIEMILRGLLEEEGYQLSSFKFHGETGEDIIASKEDELPICIEVIGYKSNGSTRSRDFYEAFFRAISRLKENPVKIVIAMSSLAKEGLPRRVCQYEIAWQRIGISFPELELWLIDTENFTYQRTLWNDWLRR